MLYGLTFQIELINPITIKSKVAAIRPTFSVSLYLNVNEFGKYDWELFKIKLMEDLW